MHLADALSKATHIAFKLQFYIFVSSCFPGKRNHDLGIASTMRTMSYSKADEAK